MSKLLDNYTAADSDAFADNIHREAEGYWKPIYPDEVGRALKHVEANYNYKVLTGTVANYRIYPSTVSPGSTGAQVEDFTGDDDKVLTLKYDGTEGWYWTLSQGGTGGGPSGPSGPSGPQGNASTVPGPTGPSGPSGPNGTNYWSAGNAQNEITYENNVNIGGQAWSNISTPQNGQGGTTISWNSGNSAQVQLGGGTWNLTLTNPKAGATYFLKLITAASGSATTAVTFTTSQSSIKWPDGTAYVPSSGYSKVDSIVLFFDGTNYLANATLNYS